MNSFLNEQTFRPYQPLAPTRVSYRRLPHWHQEQTCAFVTFRLNDSLPESARKEFERQKRGWLSERGWPPDLTEEEILEKLPPLYKNRFQRFASSRYQKLLDRGLGTCALQDPAIRQLVEAGLRYGAGSRYLLGDYVVMPNHVHALMQPLPYQDLREALGNLRHFTARQINQKLGRKGSFWMAEPFDHLIRRLFYFRKYRSYIRLNPVRARLSPMQYTHFQVEG